MAGRSLFSDHDTLLRLSRISLLFPTRIPDGQSIDGDRVGVGPTYDFGRVGDSRSRARSQNDYSRLDRLAESIERCHLALQYLDDLQDWHSDARRGLPTLVTVRLFDSRPDSTEIERAEVREAAARRLYGEGHAADVLQAAIA